MSPEVKKHDRLYNGGFQEGFPEHRQEDLKEKLFELIKSNFPKLDIEDISRAAGQFVEFDLIELEMLLNPGKFITKKGKRVQEAYLRTAPVIYKLMKLTAVRTDQIDHTNLTDQKCQMDNTNLTDHTNLTGQKGQIHQTDRISQDFRVWLSIASKSSELSFSCFEGFFNSSALILEKKGRQGLPLLEKWMEIGSSIAEKNNRFAMIYFNHTACILISAGFSAAATSTSLSGDSPGDSEELESFRELISLGEKFDGLNPRVAEVYFEHLPDMLALLSPEDFQLFYSIIDRLLTVQWGVAVDMLVAATDVFSAVPLKRRKELLTALNEFTGCLDGCPNGFPDHKYIAASSLALFKNTPQVMVKLDERGFEAWISVAEEVINISVDAAVIFLNRSPAVLTTLKINELQQWAEKGITYLYSEKKAFESFYEGSFKGLEKYLKSANSEERELLLDIGTKIALINPGCTDSYFENSPVALRLLSGREFRAWVDIGARISKESYNLGSGYFKNSVASFRKIPPSYHGEILEIAESLLEKDWLLAGKFFEGLPNVAEKTEYKHIKKWADTGTKVYDADRNLAVDYFTYSPLLLTELDVLELEEWALKGLEIFENNTYLGRPYFSLKSRISKDFIEELTGGVALNRVTNILRYYAIGLSGIGFKIMSKTALPGYRETDPVNPVISGSTIYLEPKIKKFGNFQDNFKIYKLSVMHEVGHAQFSSSKISSELLHGLVNRITEKYGFEPTRRTDKRADGAENFKKVENVKKAERAKENGRDESNENRDQFSKGVFSGNKVDISSIIEMFPNRVLAASILGVLEDARVEYLIMDIYRGVRSDLESIRAQMLLRRPVPEGKLERFMEALLWLSAANEPPFDLTEDYRFLLDTVRNILQNQVLKCDSSTTTSLEAAFTIYDLLENLLGPLEHCKYEMLKNIEYRGMGLGSLNAKNTLPDDHKSVIESFIPENDNFSVIEKKQHEEKKPEKREPEKDNLEKKPSYAADRNWKVIGSYRYDEWDYAINDYKSDWCVVNEIEPAGGAGEYYTGASERYRNEIALIKNVFTRMKPESFHRLKGQTDGTEIDIDAFSDALIERRCGINPDEKLYVRWDKRKRDVATLFLVDVSASTRKRLHREGGSIEERRSIGESRSLIDVEKDALVIMVQALETIGDKYAIYAFSGHTKENVEYYIIKDFGEELAGDVEKRISLLEPVANTRLGPAIRHSIRKLEEVSARTKVLILLSDGEPYDTCYGEGAYQGKYAEEDTKTAVQEGSARDIHFFCITVDTSPGDYLENIFSDLGYTIIDDARLLPERLPLLYKRITT